MDNAILSLCRSRGYVNVFILLLLYGRSECDNDTLCVNERIYASFRLIILLLQQLVPGGKLVIFPEIFIALVVHNNFNWLLSYVNMIRNNIIYRSGNWAEINFFFYKTRDNRTKISKHLRRQNLIIIKLLYILYYITYLLPMYVYIYV